MRRLAVLLRAAQGIPRRLTLSVVLRVAERGAALAPLFLLYALLHGQLTLPALCAALLALLGLQYLCAWQGQLLGFLGGYDLTLRLRERATDHLRALPLGLLRQRRLGDLGALLGEDMQRTESIFVHLFAELAAALILPLLAVAALALILPAPALALLAVLPLACLAPLASSRWFMRRARGLQDSLRDASSQILEFLGGLATLRLFARSADWLRRLDALFLQLRRQSLGLEAWAGGPVQLYRILLELGVPLGLLLFAAAPVHDDPAAGLLFLLVAYRILDPLLDAAAHVAELRYLASGMRRIQALLHQPAFAADTGIVPTGAAHIAFEQVSFSHQVDTPTLIELSFTARAGELTAIVGPSGAGKTTILELLARFHDPDRGSILLGGLPLREIGTDALYRRISVMFQQVQLIHGNLLDNVRIGRPNADDDQVMAACRAAGCDDFAAHLPQGYATPIGEDGQLLSGGERQRLALARALLKDAPILLLDEATAAVDALTQGVVQHGVAQLTAGKTVIAVAHRLHTIRHADQILVLANGRLAERGRHDELLAANGLYASLWRAQNPTDYAHPLNAGED
ncbi:ABC transporter ATP-binding protein [Cupriavidus basilensis]|uniref:ABC transporter ATP-binding protein n=1 Tax=Cupriavidus basilensis TaxID=68895 RepID=A0ABT6B2U7_9BURK|nr:ABC transporter ATP-binding protein [Cupriavidus basilensis]MDF3839200.1 ABC transporter ATP-binding protein [Cupriavidus basilensis]